MRDMGKETNNLIADLGDRLMETELTLGLSVQEEINRIYISIEPQEKTEQWSVALDFTACVFCGRICYLV